MRFDAAKIQDLGKKGTRDAFGDALLEIGRSNPDVVVLAADCMGSVRAKPFADKFPERAFNFGIAEQGMICAAAGFACSGKIPIACTFAFLASMRACEQVRTSVAYPNLNVKIVATNSGLCMGTAGPSHSCTEDLSIIRSFANMTIVCPADGVETFKAMRAIVNFRGPVYFRLGRGGEPAVYKEDYDFQIGKAVQLRNGNDATLIATGMMVLPALQGADDLAKEGVNVRVLNIHTIKPLDDEAILRAARETGAIVTVEENNIMGGLGGAVAELLSEQCPTRMRRIGIRDVFCEIGPADGLRERCGLAPANIANAVKELIGLKQK